MVQASQLHKKKQRLLNVASIEEIFEKYFVVVFRLN